MIDQLVQRSTVLRPHAVWGALRITAGGETAATRNMAVVVSDVRRDRCLKRLPTSVLAWLASLLVFGAFPVALAAPPASVGNGSAQGESMERVVADATVAQNAALPDRAVVDATVEHNAMLTERAVVDAALEHNPTLAASVRELRRAELLEQAEEHRHSFVLALDGSATRSKSPSLGPTGVNTPESNSYSAGAELRRHFGLGTDVALRLEGTSQSMNSIFVNPATNPPMVRIFSMGPSYGTSVKLTLTQPLLRGAGRDVYEAELNAARASRASAQSARDQAASQLLADVLIAYWELYHASRNVEIQKKSLELARAQLEETAARVRTGSAAPVDALSFETRIASLEEDLASARATEQTKSTELARLLGRATLGEQRVDTGTSPPEPLSPSPDSAEKALQASFELEQQRAAVRLAEVQARTAAEPFRSRLDLNAYVQAYGLGNQQVPPAFEQLAGLGAVSAHVGFTYEAPLDGTQQRKERERALLAVEVAKQRLAALEQRVAADVSKALAQEESGRRRVALADKTLDIAQHQVEAEVRRFRTGSATALQVREAEDQVRSAELRAARARVDRIEASVTIEHLSGRLLEHWAKTLR